MVTRIRAVVRLKIASQVLITAGFLAFGAQAVLADYESGVNAALNGEFDKAFTEFSVAAEEGLHMAQYNLAILYFTGQGVKQDYDEAFKWTSAAANQGHVAAQYNLGSLYFEGQGTGRDRQQAVQWYAEAARNGHSGSALLLAQMYKEGSSVAKDPVQSHAWATVAKAAESEEAEAFIAELERAMDSSEISEARRVYARWQLQ